MSGRNESPPRVRLHPRRALALATLVAGLAAAGLAQGSATRAASTAGADSLGWLSGCWASATAEPGSGEFWTAPAGGTLLGVARTIRQGRTVAHEFMVIRTDADGHTTLQAAPSGQAPASFEMTEIGPNRVVFSNPEHDFPTSIRYQASSKSGLIAAIEGPDGSGTKRIEFAYSRQPCTPN